MTSSKLGRDSIPPNLVHFKDAHAVANSIASLMVLLSSINLISIIKKERFIKNLLLLETSSKQFWGKTLDKNL